MSRYKVHYRRSRSGLRRIYDRINERYFDDDVSLGFVIGAIAFGVAIYLAFCAFSLIWQGFTYG